MSRIYPRGRKKIYYIDHRTNGQRRVESLRTTSKTEARQLQEVIDDQDRRSRFGKTIDLDMPLVELFDRFRSFSSNNHAKSTQEDYRYYIDGIFAPYFADYTIRQFNSAIIEQFKNSAFVRISPPRRGGRKREFVRSGATVNKMIRYLRSIVRFGKDQGIIPEEMRINTRALRVNETRGRVLSLAEIEQIRKNGGVYTAILMTALYTGMRVGELLNLKWSQVDFEARVIDVVNDAHFQTKNRRNRLVPIGKPLHQILTRHRETAAKSEFVFPKKDGAQLRDCRWAVERLIRDHGMAKFSFHDLRRTFATLLAAANQDVTVAKNILGHSDIRTTVQYYTRASTDRNRKAIDELPY